MEVMEQNGFRGSFFVDYLMFRELEKLSDQWSMTDLKLLKDQIRDMVKRGHRVELHLHPHWIDAKYNGDGTWDFSDFTHYRLSTLDEDTIIKMFKEGTEYLNGLAREVELGYRIVAFRAGGWAVQPFDKLKNGFETSGILIDSSTSKGMYCLEKDKSFDFRNMPDGIYHFEDDVCQEKTNGIFIEVPITSYKQNWLLKLVNAMCSSETERVTDGTHIRSCEKREPTPKRTFRDKLFSERQFMLSFSQFSSKAVFLAILLNRSTVVCAIDHPKDFSKETIKGIKLISKICNNYSFNELKYDTKDYIF